MMEASYALQTAIRAALAAFGPLADLVPAANILDHTGAAARFPSVLIGEGQTVNVQMNYERDAVRVFLDLHIWAKANDLGPAKTIAGAIKDALRNITPWMITDHRVVDLFVQSSRFLRDKESETPLAHGVVQITALLQETVPA